MQKRNSHLQNAPQQDCRIVHLINFPDRRMRNGKDGWNYPAIEKGTGSTDPPAQRRCSCAGRIWWGIQKRYWTTKTLSSGTSTYCSCTTCAMGKGQRNRKFKEKP